MPGLWSAFAGQPTHKKFARRRPGAIAHTVAQVATLAFPIVGLHTCVVAVVFKYVFPFGWSWPESFLFGSIISATDPVAVVAIMKEVGASKRLGHLIEGEYAPRAIRHAAAALGPPRVLTRAASSSCSLLPWIAVGDQNKSVPH